MPTSTDIDRIGPTRRPDRRVVMRQRWRNLLFLHWPIEVEQLRPLIPERLTIDTFDGVAYVGLVPFTMQGVRPVGLPAVPWLSNFHETNVRTYVHLDGKDPGVWFFSLDAANPIAVQLARRLFHLPYYDARMSLKARGPGGELAADSTTSLPVGSTLHYYSQRTWDEPAPATTAIRARVTGPAFQAVPGTLEHFLAERYLLYANHPKRGVKVGQVYHTSYPIQPAEVEALDETVIPAAKLTRPAGFPPLAHFASGVDVDIFALQSAQRI